MGLKWAAHTYLRSVFSLDGSMLLHVAAWPLYYVYYVAIGWRPVLVRGW